LHVSEAYHLDLGDMLLHVSNRIPSGDVLSVLPFVNNPGR